MDIYRIDWKHFESLLDAVAAAKDKGQKEKSKDELRDWVEDMRKSFSRNDDRIEDLQEKVRRLEAKIQRVCPHPWDKVVVDHTGAVTFEGGSMNDTVVQLLVCTQCGHVLTIEEEHERSPRSDEPSPELP